MSSNAELVVNKLNIRTKSLVKHIKKTILKCKTEYDIFNSCNNTITKYNSDLNTSLNSIQNAIKEYNSQTSMMNIKNTNIESINSRISLHQKDKNICTSDYNNINSICDTINSYRSEAGIIVDNL